MIVVVRGPLIEHALSCRKGGLVLERHEDAAKEWGALGARYLVLSAITYEPKSIVGQYRGRVRGLDRGKRMEWWLAAHLLYEKPKGVCQLTGRLD